ncbi:hypothetical protein EFE32_06420 [Lactococcus lactis subsp. lactis]|uniref:hypothetical protein n=1 Tax=Lactococcus lactis TaxID=1358 RepID=UPI00223B6138|nr:hypothetical protein [Lactococcus lactis]MCT0016483.1 hypothetical protein [Lactococcus lactis subsp. lactis]
MNKNLNPLNWKRSQQVVGGAIAILLVGAVTTGVAVNANQKAEEKKIEQLSKEKVKKAEARAEKAKQLEKSSEADSKKLLDIAEKTPTDKNIKLAEDSILKVKNVEVKKAFDNQIVGIKNRVKLENEAKTAVSNYQKDAMNNDKYKTAQQAISKLTSSYSKGLKDTLNKQLATSKKQADDATKAQQAKSASDSKAKTADTNKQESGSTGATNENSNNANVATDTQNTANNDVASGSNSYSDGNQNNYSQGNSNSGSYNQGNSGQGNSNSNSNTNTGGNGSNSNSNANTGGNGSNSNNGSNGGGNTGQPSHTTKYLGWVSVDGVRKYTKLCDTVAEAQSFATSTANSPEVTELLFEGHSINYGLDTVEV